MSKSNELLPLGSIVYLEEGTRKLVIVGRGVIFEDEESDGQVFADYMGVLYPIGLQTESTIFFNMKILIKLFLEDIQMRRKIVLWISTVNGKKI